ncbi:MAG: ABC transporter permease [Saprospiraceae bacterium]
MKKIIIYSLKDLLRSNWIYFYSVFFLLTTMALGWMSQDPLKVVVSLLNIILILVPLVSLLFGLMYIYNMREFTELLLAQPLPRMHVFGGQYAGLVIALSISCLAGIGIPFLILSLHQTVIWFQVSSLCVVGVALTLIFSGFAFFIGLRFENRIKGFAAGLTVWLFFAVIYDGIFLWVLTIFQDYPLEKFTLGMSWMNPIDLGRTLLLLQLDISSLLGYTGAVFQHFLGTVWGKILSGGILVLWIGIPLWGVRRLAKRKDF